jgi:hypothetical protein
MLDLTLSLITVIVLIISNLLQIYFFLINLEFQWSHSLKIRFLFFNIHSKLTYIHKIKIFEVKIFFLVYFLIKIANLFLYYI